MSSFSLFDTMEFPMATENYLDESFGLSAEILAADLVGENCILDTDIGQLGGLKYESEQPAPVKLEDGLMLPEVADSLGHDWMEKVDLRSLLNNMDGLLLPAPTSQPTIELVVSPPVADTTSEKEDRKEGMKVSAYEKLKALLTGQTSDNDFELTTVQPPPSPQSPEAIVPNLQFVAPSFESLLDESSQNVMEDLIQIPPMDTSGDIEIALQPELDLVELLSPVTDVSPSTSNYEADSQFTSGPSSPSDSFTLDTVDLEQLNDFTPVSDEGCTISEEFTKLKSRPKRDSVRTVPYENVSHIDNKKDRKKVQNKNAATRYRVKKRSEKESLQQQESNLTDKNKELKEKVESLQREISYMKELMNEIYKAKKSKH